MDGGGKEGSKFDFSDSGLHIRLSFAKSSFLLFGFVGLGKNPLCYLYPGP